MILSVKRLVLRTCVVLSGSLPAVAAFSQNPSRGIALVPIPQEIQQAGSLKLSESVYIPTAANPEDEFAAQDLTEALAAMGVRREIRKHSKISIVLLRTETPQAKHILAEKHVEFTATMSNEGYVLTWDNNTLFDIAATGAGVFYGVQTIKQLIQRQEDGVILSNATVRDWPAMRYRAQDDDLSRGPFPTLAYQKRQIRTFAAYKLNIYSPYFENNLQYASEPLPAPPGGAMSSEEVRELVAYARQYHVNVLPQQEAFGHLHHVLLYDLYSQLAEIPHGTVLSPAQAGSLQLIQRWSSEVADAFPSPFLHIGADETDDLGMGQTKEAVARNGLGRVYIDFVKEIHEALLPLHKRLLFWGDVAMNSPELVKELPKDLIAVPWQYSMPENTAEGFGRWIKPFVDAGLETWVAPSAARGNRIDADDENNLRTIQAFVADGQKLGATGMFNTVWDDGGEGLFEQDWYSVLFGAAACWQSGRSDISRFQRSYGQVFHGDSSGNIDQAMTELMQAHKVLSGAGLSATNTLFWEDPWSPSGQLDAKKILPTVHELRVHAEKSIVLFEKAKRLKNLRNTETLDALALGARKMDFIGQKFEEGQEIVLAYRALYAQRNNPEKHDQLVDDSYAITGNNGQCQDLRDGYGLLRDLFQNAWLRENRPYWLDNVMAQYLLNMQLWIGRGTAIRAAMNAFEEAGKLAPPEQMGMPGGDI